MARGAIAVPGKLGFASLYATTEDVSNLLLQPRAGCLGVCLDARCQQKARLQPRKSLPKSCLTDHHISIRNTIHSVWLRTRAD
jgi:hypothetical protein